MKKIRFSKKETKRYAWAINYIRDEMATGRDFWASMGSAGFTFWDDIGRLSRYAEVVEAHDIVDLIAAARVKQHKYAA